MPARRTGTRVGNDRSAAIWPCGRRGTADPSATFPASNSLRRSGRREPHRASHWPAAPACARWQPVPLRTPPPRADHVVPMGPAACGQLRRPHRGQYWRRTAVVCRRGVRLLPRVRHPGAPRSDAALRGVWPRQAAGVRLQAARPVPLVRGQADIADGSAPGGPRHGPRESAPAGPFSADSAARAAGRAARAGHAGVAGGAARGHPRARRAPTRHREVHEGQAVRRPGARPPAAGGVKKPPQSMRHPPAAWHSAPCRPGPAATAAPPPGQCRCRRAGC